MSNFSRWQELNQKRQLANKVRNTSFVFTANNSIDLTLFLEEEKQVRASVVSRQEKDLAYIYTELDSPIEIGTICGAKGLKWLVSEEIVLIQDVNWHKYSAFLCNAEIDGNWGYFKGPEKTWIKVELNQSVLLQSNQHPVLVLGGHPYKINDKIKIKDRAWLIQEEDVISTEGVSYYSLRPTTMSKGIEGDKESPSDVRPSFIDDIDLTKDVIEVAQNKNITISTKNGYFKSSNAMISIIEHTATKVVFNLPYGVQETVITYRNENDVLVSKIFKGVM